MTADIRVRELPQALRSAMIDGDKERADAAIAALREYAAEGLGQPALDVARNLADLAKHPMSDSAVTAFAAATRQLDQAVEAKCHTQ